MAIYKDKNTGAVVVTDSVLSGDWELVKETVKEKKEEAK
jgi:N12 class adenine-specific DNA methylase